PHLSLTPEPLEWRSNLGLRGLKALKVKVGEPSRSESSERSPQQGRSDAKSGTPSGCPYEAQGSSDRQALIKKYLQSRMSHQAENAPSIPRRGETGPAPLSFAQEQIWLHCQFARDLYNESVTVYRR